MLHVLDGDAIRSDFDAAGLEGAVVVWREACIEDPWPRALRGVEATVARVEEAAKSGEEVVAWFDADLFCRLNAACLVALVPHARWTNALGNHAHRDDLRGCFDRRVAMPPRLADVWRAYVGDDPRALLPFLDAFPWVALHLARFPHARDGLAATERRLLEAMRDGALPFPALYARVADPALGLGDAQVERLLVELAPLARQDGERWSLTDTGRNVLAGRADRWTIAPMDRWLGGVHLTSGRPEWRWDGASLLRA